MNITIVIRCCHDFKVFDCIKSVDEDVEIIVSMCQNQQIQEKLEEKGIRYCISPKGNLSITSNNGFKLATFEKVIITDSDTQFAPNCIKKIYNALDDFKIVKAKIIFKSNPESRFSDIIAEARDYVNSLPVIYTPGIGVRKEIITYIDGFLFNEKVPFAVDADLTYRVKKAKIPAKCIHSANIIHKPEKLLHDLRAAFRIGGGCMSSALTLSTIYNTKIGRIFYSLKGVKPNLYFDLIRKKGMKIFIFQLIWDAFFYLGALLTLLFNKI